MNIYREKVNGCDPAGQLAGPEDRRVLVVHNPVAGGRRRARMDAVARALVGRGCAVEVRLTEHAGHAESLVRDLSLADFEIVAVSGGDGTINEVLNALGPASPRLAIIPNGTANVLAQEIGLPARPAAVAGLIAEGQPEPLHPGVANDRRFAMMAGVGYDAHVVEGVDPRLKRRLGKGAYVWRSIAQMPTFDFHPYDIAIDGVATRACSAIVANGRFYAGRHLVAPEGRLDRPDFEICLFRRGGAWNVTRYGLALLAGLLPRLEDFQIRRGRTVEIAGRPGEPVQADGEIVARLPVRITVAAEPVWILREPPVA